MSLWASHWWLWSMHVSVCDCFRSIADLWLSLSQNVKKKKKKPFLLEWSQALHTVKWPPDLCSLDTSLIPAHGRGRSMKMWSRAVLLFSFSVFYFVSSFLNWNKNLKDSQNSFSGHWFQMLFFILFLFFFTSITFLKESMSHFRCFMKKSHSKNSN